MYKDIVNELNESVTEERVKKQFKIFKKTLNLKNLMEVLDRGTKVLHLYCHGDKSNTGSHLCFESNRSNEVGLLKEFSEQNLVSLLEESKCKVKLVVLSACHSSNLG